MWSKQCLFTKQNYDILYVCMCVYVYAQRVPVMWGTHNCINDDDGKTNEEIGTIQDILK